jgi:O-antigen ligase
MSEPDPAPSEPRASSGEPSARALVLAVAALIVAVLPLGGAFAWGRFVVSAALVAGAVLAHREGPVWAAAVLFVTIALKDGVLVVSDAYVGFFHVVLAGSVLAAVARAWQARVLPSVRLGGLEWALLLIPLAGLLSLPASLAPADTALAVGRLLMLWVAMLVVSRLLVTPGSQRTALVAFTVAAVALALVGFVQWLAPGLGIGPVSPPVAPSGRPAGFYLDPNFLGAHLVLAALAALWFAGGARRWWLWVVAATGLLGVVALTYSRSAWVAAAVGIAATLVLGTRRVRIIALGTALAAALAGLVLLGPGLVVDRALSVFEIEGDTSNATRVLMARSSLAMIADRPLTGVGLKAFDVAYPPYVLPGAEQSISHPHQVPLPFVAETGIAGAVALVAAVIAGVAAMIAARRSGAAVGGAVTAGVLALGVGSLFQFFLYYEVAWLFAGLLAAAARLGSGDVSQRARART